METAGAVAAIKRFGDRVAVFAARIKKLSAPVLKVLTFSPANDFIAPASAFCAQIGKGRLDVVYASRSFSKYSVKSYKTYGFGEETMPSPAEVASKLTIAMKDFDIRRADVQLIIPKSWVAMRTALLPAAVRENLSEVVRFELDRLTPFSADEALYDFLAGDEADGQIALFISAARAGAITDYSSGLAERGINVGSVTFDVSCLATLCRFASGYDSFIFSEVDGSGIKSGTVENGMLKSSSSQEFRCDDEVLMAVIIEDHLADQKATAGDSGKDMPVILLFREETASLGDLLRSRGNTAFETLNNLGRKMSGVPALDGMRTVAIGGALEQLWPQARAYNLLSKGVKERARKPFLLTIILVIALVACMSALRLASVQTQAETLTEINHQINIRKAEVQSVEKIKGEIEAINKRLALINNFRHDKPLYIDLLKELTLLIPKNTWLTRVRIAGTQVSIEGYAPSATSLVQILEESKSFEKAEFASPTFRDARMNMDRFQIKMEIRGSKPAEAGNEKK